MNGHAILSVNGRPCELPLVEGTEREIGIDITQLRSQTGCITLDEGYTNTGSCQSSITFVDGINGILRYRGYPIEELARHSTFVETAYLLIFGELPNQAQLAEFRSLLSEHEFMHEDMRHHFEGFPPHAHPMAILSAMVNALGCYQPVLLQPEDDEHFADAAARLMSKIRTIAAASYKKSIGQPRIYPRPDLQYVPNFLHMLFSKPNQPFEPTDDIVNALQLILILHADHEQNCSTSTVRMVASGQANLYASVSAGICALWGHLHGGAQQTVIEMLSNLHETRESVASFVGRIKSKQGPSRLMGFGHRVYTHFDPRAALLKEACHTIFQGPGRRDPLLEIAAELEQAALADAYFTERELYPNVDFYSGIMLHAIGMPLSMFPVIFAIGRLPGWIAQWREVHLNPRPRIYRPRQIYIGARRRAYAPVEDRGSHEKPNAGPSAERAGRSSEAPVSPSRPAQIEGVAGSR